MYDRAFTFLGVRSRDEVSRSRETCRSSFREVFRVAAQSGDSPVSYVGGEANRACPSLLSALWTPLPTPGKELLVHSNPGGPQASPGGEKVSVTASHAV